MTSGAEGRTSPFGMLRFAEEYRRAAALVEKAEDAQAFSSPAYMLVGQSIELSLKAFLLARGVVLKALKFEYGHDLEALLEEAERRNLAEFVPLESFHSDAIRLLSPLYKAHEFRYITTGFRTVPSWGFIFHAASELTRLQHDWLLAELVGEETAAKRIAARGRFK